MAGVGFELRKLLKKGRYYDLVKAYGYAGMLSSGPWVISILAILFLGLMAHASNLSNVLVAEFQTTVTYMIAASLIFSSFAQHFFTRFVADRLFEKQLHVIIPNFFGMMLITLLASGTLGLIISLIFFQDMTLAYRVITVCTFTALCGIWPATNLLSSLKIYKTISAVFALGYGSSVMLGFLLRKEGLDAILFGFFIGQFILLISMLIILFCVYKPWRLIKFDFLFKNQVFWSLVFSSTFYNLGVWADKIIFWFAPSTSIHVIGPLRASPIYDVPIFLSFLAIIPGMAVFLFRMETDFVEYYKSYYDAILYGGTLNQIYSLRNQMVETAHRGIFEIVRIQALVSIIVFLLSDKILTFLGLSVHYSYLLSVDVIGAGLLVVFLGLLNICFYMDKRKKAMWLSCLFMVLNFIFTLITIYLGPFYYGYGFVISLVITDTLALYLIDRAFNNLEYHTFMFAR